MLWIQLLFSSKLFGIPSAHAYELHTKIVTFLIEKIKLVSFSLFLDASPPPPRPKMPFGQCYVPKYIYNICKGCLWSRGGGGCISKRRHQTSGKNGPRRKMVVLFVHQLYKYIYSIAIGRLFSQVLRSGSHTSC